MVKNFDFGYSPTGSTGCFPILITDGFPDHIQYYKGLGGGYYDNNTNSIGLDWHKLLYYKKGSVVWGTPVNQGLLTGVHETNAKHGAILISPNPIIESATVEINGTAPAENITFTLTDLIGKEALRLESNEAKFKIDRGNLSPGLYLYSVKSNATVFKQGKIILQ